MVVGFTGTRKGLRSPQNVTMRRFIRDIGMTRFVHGGAPGSDTLAHYATRAYYRDICIEIHPCPQPGSTVWLPMGNCEIYPELPPLERNRIIVGRIHGLLAAPATDVEAASGTWATVRYAREIGCPVYIIRQDGKLVCDPPTYEKWLSPL